jgi:hypothetical protein
MDMTALLWISDMARGGDPGENAYQLNPVYPLPVEKL